MTTTDTSEGFDWSNPSVVRLIERYITLNRKALPQDAEQSRVVREVAEYYAANYEGAFLFMCEMRAAIEKWHKLSTGQAAATINCLMAEYKRRQAPVKSTFKMPTAQLPDLAAEQEEINAKVRLDRQAAKEVAPASAEPLTSVVHNGTYTIVLNEAGDYRTIRLSDVPESMGKPKGMQIAAYLSGPDNEANYTGFAFVTGDSFHIWKAFKDVKANNTLAHALITLLNANTETRSEYGYAYAVESGRCYHCGRKLTVPASIHKGLGPKCAAQLGYL